MAQLRFDSRPLVMRRAYTATMRATVILPWREQVNHGLHLCLTIAASVIARNVANQQVLDGIGPQVLGKLYVTVAIVAGMALAAVGYSARNRDARDVVGVAHMIVATTMGLAFVAPRIHPAVAIVTYVVMEIDAAVLLLAFGIMLGARLGPREARRVAGRVGAGGILGGLLAGAALSLGAPLLGSRTLFLVSAGFALAPVFFLPQSREPAATAPSEMRRDRADVRELSRYGWSVALTSLVMVATTTLIDYQFRFVARQWFDADNMTAFFGLVVTLAGGATLLFQLLLLDRALDRYGLFATAAIMPAGLIVAGAVFGLLPTLVTLVIFKLVDSSANMSVQQATGGLLLAPLGTRARAVWLGRIDGLAKRSGQVMTGLFLAFFPWSPARVLPITLALCALWLLALLLTRGRYVRLLTAMLGAPTASEPELGAYDGHTLRLLENELATASVRRAAVILDLLEQAERRAPDALLQRLADADASGEAPSWLSITCRPCATSTGYAALPRAPTPTSPGRRCWR